MASQGPRKSFRHTGLGDLESELGELAVQQAKDGSAIPFTDRSSHYEKVPAEPPDDALGRTIGKLWEESVWMAPVIDEALLQVGSPRYNFKVLEDDGEAKEGKALPCFQTEFG